MSPLSLIADGRLMENPSGKGSARISYSRGSGGPLRDQRDNARRARMMRRRPASFLEDLIVCRLESWNSWKPWRISLAMELDSIAELWFEV
jgi:hypothetical protein